MEQGYFESTLGWIKICSDANEIISVGFLDETPNEITSSIDKTILECIHQLKEYFEGKRKTFELKLNPAGTNFQRKVWDELQHIPFGKTTTYLAMAKKLGDKKVIRAAASANGKNPIAIIIPCHRVIGSNGDLVGYAGGMERKRKLLELEQGIFQMSLL